ncbi:MAG: 3-keto-disaccharide hydrolase [Bacteroidota bacterium]
MKISNLILISLIGFGLLFSSCESSEEDSDQSEEQAEEAPVNTLTEAEKEDDWQLLFDGEDPSEHWRGYCDEAFPDSGWTVEDNALKVIGSGSGEAGGEGGDVISKEKYTDFELQLEWKVEKGGNSGIFYLAEELCDEGEPIWKSAPEMQILDNENHPDAKMGEDGNRQAGSLYDMIPADPQNANPHGEWNTARIMVYQGTVVHYQNGEKILEYHLWTDDWKEMVENSKFDEFSGFEDVAKEGYIGLQDHGNDVWFRNIKIKDMSN